MTSGIYKLYFKQNPNHFYIGSSRDINQRFREHKSQLTREAHANPILNRAFKKYGTENFISEFVEECSLDCLRQVEQKYIDTLKPHYNISKRADGGKCSNYWVLNYKRNYKLVYGIKEECKKLGIHLGPLKKYSEKYLPAPNGYLYRPLSKEEYELGYMFHNRTGYLFINSCKVKGSPNPQFKFFLRYLRTQRASLEEILDCRNKVINNNIKEAFSQLTDLSMTHNYTKLSTEVIKFLDNKNLA